ncbi:DExH-box splicing factor binding site-domain-containing protein [Dactylonectria macrodidyma]|uniref:Pre-mRNA-splicing factor n=1 Tax=Dactylonectria macrodidyma TaxID=307937 RepID=A0A9P9ET64_9HYPO|nr:DExH-box splicing factor binding site-domain-containing protein [Dactylonectria macrodidyma]
MSDQNRGTAPRIAIKFGTPSSNSSVKKSSRPNPPSTLGKRFRSNTWGGGSDSEPDGDQGQGRHEKITGFGQDGAETERKSKDARTEKKQYVIARQANRDWRSEVKTQRKGRNLLPEEARAQNNSTTVETEPADQDKGLKWGLTIKEKTVKNEHEEDSNFSENASPKDSPKQDPPPKRTADDEAMDALLGNNAYDEKVIHPTEEDAFKRDIEQAGEASTLEDYEAMPVEEFGAALLRGMGWDGKDRGTKVKEVKRRPNRLGLGAKELKEDEDLGGWNQGGKKNRRPRLNDYRREEAKRKESRQSEDSYKREREREKERERHGYREHEHERNRDRDHDHDRDRHRRDKEHDRHRDRHRDHDRGRRR